MVINALNAGLGGEGEEIDPVTDTSVADAEGEQDFDELLAFLAEDFAGVANRRRRV